jgi:hypothetical protein
MVYLVIGPATMQQRPAQAMRQISFGAYNNT